jgi:copper chaperone/Cu+-exporting ATPase
MEQVRLQVRGIYCEKCLKKLKETLEKHQEISEVAVGDDLKTVDVKFSGHAMAEETLISLIETVPEKEFSVIKK